MAYPGYQPTLNLEPILKNHTKIMTYIIDTKHYLRKGDDAYY